MKKKYRYRAIACYPGYGPIFGSGRDKGICDNCNKNGGWTCYGNRDSSYECNNSLKQSLFVNTAGPNEQNDFSVLDYELYSNSNICSCCIC